MVTLVRDDEKHVLRNSCRRLCYTPNHFEQIIDRHPNLRHGIPYVWKAVLPSFLIRKLHLLVTFIQEPQQLQWIICELQEFHFDVCRVYSDEVRVKEFWFFTNLC